MTGYNDMIQYDSYCRMKSLPFGDLMVRSYGTEEVYMGSNQSCNLGYIYIYHL